MILEIITLIAIFLIGADCLLDHQPITGFLFVAGSLVVLHFLWPYW
jgi:hypothetical protein